MAGLFSEMFKELERFGVRPNTIISQNVVRVELTADDIAKIAFAGVDERIKKYMSVRIEDNKIVFEVRLL